MTTYPQPADPVSALTRADGTTEAHSEDHSHVIGLNVNAKKYLRGDGATESQTAIDAFAAACAGKHGFFPAGTYKWPDGGTLSVSQFTQYRGAGSHAVTITTKDAYAFTAAAGADKSDVVLADIGHECRTGSVSGGLINQLTTCSGWKIERVLSTGVTTNLTPLMKLRGFIGSYVQKFRVVANGGDGILMESSNNVCNQWRIAEGRINANCLASATLYAGIHVTGGGSLGVLEMNDFESNHGRGVWYDGGAGQTQIVRNNWFEDNYYTSIDIDSYAPVIIESNEFQEPHNPETANTRHIYIQNGQGHVVIYNKFCGPNNGGPAALEIAGGEGSYIFANQGITSHVATGAPQLIISNGHNHYIHFNTQSGLTPTNWIVGDMPFAVNKLRFAKMLMLAADAPAATILGGVIRKIPVYDDNGDGPLGYIPVYNAIT